MPSSSGPLSGHRNKLKNHPRERGTSPPQRAITEFEPGERVHLKIDPSVQKGRFNPRFGGHTGEILGKQGRAYRVKITDGDKEKVLVTIAAHLKRQA